VGLPVKENLPGFARCYDVFYGTLRIFGELRGLVPGEADRQAILADFIVS
jgi:hypothetical protein